ncbi:hypothetical protein GH810_13975 [Acetobacterium paludosum]|uniref:Creatinine amidohydrolase n=1 Tax=Acetobacterium paludosum TaxID=52693 RepID=A0A923HZE1_9FIRM|nr:creatininase family protein [Acetobacterium paludosum]MBC3889419.1 hypothetical protein [Acetobacterium paludosum]
MRLNILEINWPEVEQCNKEKTIAFIGLAPIEEHGRHLPLGVDVYETQYWMENSLSKLEVEFGDYTFLTMPVITFGHANMKGIPGNIHLSQQLLYELVLATVNNIVEWGIEHIVIISGHADPKHTIAIEQACEKVNNENGIVAFAPMGAIFSGKVPIKAGNQDQDMKQKLKAYPNDFHAGWIETSNMLEIRKDLVKHDFMKQPDIIVNDKDMLNPEVVMTKTSGYGHLGYPKEASAMLGKTLNMAVIEKIRYCTSCFIKRQNFQQFAHHKLYGIPSLHVKGVE